ncbi:glycosyltransferase [Rhodopirellula sallentina]|uniref:Glycosyl transferase group 1 n=1 Tax=Rhodopirellula sallentina SM41 TaxID=1263870 RepID=M5UID4_9BACT|nr:glycosyltransferase [Rhodopirellula sallentina]EMI55773.1 glycosyl transferase group 1 [Rhodopirellula sallentina SM41]
MIPNTPLSIPTVHPMQEANKLRVLLGSTQAGWGGGEVYLRNLAKGLRDRGVEVFLAVRDASVLQEKMIAEGFTVRALSGKGRNPLQLWNLRAWLKRENISVVHCNDSHSLTGLGIAANAVRGLKVVGIRHTMFPIRSVLKYSRVADRVICVSHAVSDACVARGIPQEKLQVIHAAIEIPTVDAESRESLRKEFLPSSSHRLIVAVGNLLPCKGHETLVRAVATLKSEGNRVTAVIAGEGEHRPFLESLIRRLDVTDEVRLLGYRNDPDQLIAAADVVAHPSHSEGLCLTVAAAMILRRPVVSTNVGGLRDVLGCDPRMRSNGPFAKVFEVGNDAAMAFALRESFADSGNAELLDEASRYARNQFVTDRMVDATLNLYRELHPRVARAA